MEFQRTWSLNDLTRSIAALSNLSLHRRWPSSRGRPFSRPTSLPIAKLEEDDEDEENITKNEVDESVDDPKSELDEKCDSPEAHSLPLEDTETESFVTPKQSFDDEFFPAGDRLSVLSKCPYSHVSCIT